MNARCLACKLLYTMSEYYKMVIGCPNCQPLWHDVIMNSQKEPADAMGPQVVSEA